MYLLSQTTNTAVTFSIFFITEVKTKTKQNKKTKTWSFCLHCLVFCYLQLGAATMYGFVCFGCLI